MAKFRIQPHVRLHEWVADQNGFFADEGLDHEFETAGFAGGGWGADAAVQPADAAPLSVRSGALEDMEQGRSCAVSGACHWAVNAAASASHGKMWGAAYSVCNSGIFVAPEFLQRDQIKLAFVGRPFDRVRLMRERRIEAANVFGAQYYLLELAGFRKLVDTTFIMGFLVSDDVDRAALEAYFRAMRRAQREIDLEAERYKPLWLREIPEDLLELADVRRFGTGERIVFEPYTREMFERTHRWMAEWDLFDATAGGRAYEDAVLT
jgi:NitT/TauT family transport system substrate-binding protein